MSTPPGWALTARRDLIGRPRVAERHEPFVERITELGDPRSAAFRHVVAGLLVLRLVDDWAENAQTIPDLTLRLTWRAIHQADLGSRVRHVLDRVADAISADMNGRDPRVLVRLGAYGRTLERDEEWVLAAHVYRTAVGLAQRWSYRRVQPDLYRRLGDSLAHCGLPFEAAAAYQSAHAIASAIGATTALFRLRLAESALLVRRERRGDASGGR